MNPAVTQALARKDGFMPMRYDQVLAGVVLSVLGIPRALTAYQVEQKCICVAPQWRTLQID